MRGDVKLLHHSVHTCIEYIPVAQCLSLIVPMKTCSQNSLRVAFAVVKQIEFVSVWIIRQVG